VTFVALVWFERPHLVYRQDSCNFRTSAHFDAISCLAIQRIKRKIGVLDIQNNAYFGASVGYFQAHVLFLRDSWRYTITIFLAVRSFAAEPCRPTIGRVRHFAKPRWLSHGVQRLWGLTTAANGRGAVLSLPKSSRLPAPFIIS
jgi:hypothetical protein